MQDDDIAADVTRPGGSAEGGEALAVDRMNALHACNPASEVVRVAGVVEAPPAATAGWHALWTRSHCERLVHDQLAARGFQVFFPEVDVWSRRGTVQRLIPAPMFPGYLFLRHAFDKQSYIEVLKARGLVRILGEQWDRLDVVPDGQIEAIQRVVVAGAAVLPHRFLREGQRVRITRGPLADVEGILVASKPGKGLLVISVDLLRRSVAVEVDCTQVVAA